MSRPLREAFELGRSHWRRDRGTWAVIAAVSAGCIAAASLGVALWPSEADPTPALVERPIPVGPWAIEWSEAVSMPAAKQAGQMVALQTAAAGTLSLLALLCFLIVVALWGQRLRIRQAETFIHWAVGAGRWHAVARLAGEGRLWALAALAGVAVVVAGARAAFGLTFPGEVALTVEAKVCLIVGTGIAVALMRWEHLSASNPVRTSRVLAHELIGSPVMIATVGVAIMSGVGLLVLHAPQPRLADTTSPAIVLDTSLVGLDEDTRRERIRGVTQVMAESDLRVGIATAGTIRGAGPNELIATECGRCFEGGLPAPIKAARAEVHAVAPDSFQDLGVQIVAGRGFDPSSDDGAPSVAVVSQALARRHFERGQPIGRRVRMGFGPWLTVVGVVADAAHMSGYAQYSVYMPLSEAAPTDLEVLLASPNDLAEVEEAFVNAGFQVGAARTPAEVFALHGWFRSFLAVVGLITMAVLAAALSVSAITENRAARFELGVRRAVGARRSEMNAFFARLLSQRILIAFSLGAWLSLFIGALLSEVYATIPSSDPRALTFAVAWVGFWYVVGSVPSFRKAVRRPLMENLREAG